MSLYKSLDISDINISQNEIKKSYYRLAKIYHPDKSTDDDYESHLAKFKEINLAYEILSDSNTRLEYNNSIKNNDSPYNLLIKILKKNKLSNFLDSELIDLLINKIYGDSNKFKNKIKAHINNYEIQEIYNLFINKNKLDIVFNIEIKLDDIYDLKYKKLKIKRIINNEENEITLIIPLDPYTEELIYEDKGDIKDNKKGNIIIKFIYKEDKLYDILDNYNLLIKTRCFDSITLPDSNTVKINKKHLVFSCNEYDIYKYDFLGLINEKINKRGKLYIKNIY